MEQGKEVKIAFAPVEFPESLNTESFKARWSEFLAFRARLKKPLLPESRAAQLKTLARYGEEIAALAIEASIGNGWQGLFPEKIKPPNGSRAATGANGYVPPADGKF